MGGMPELGSRISLISKADIRYEGKLFTVDPEECTIALSSVRSFGTEDRTTTYPVPAQNQVYDYILFRGSDIKDIRVMTATIPNDPAIVQLSIPPDMGDPAYPLRVDYTATTTSGAGGAGPSSRAFSPQATQTKPANPVPTTNSATTTHISEDESRSSTPPTPSVVPNTRPNAQRGVDRQSHQNRYQGQQQRPYVRHDNRYNQHQQQRYDQQQSQRYDQQQSQRYDQHQQQRYDQHQQQRYDQHHQQRYEHNQRYDNQRYPPRYQQQARYGLQAQYNNYRDYNQQYRNYGDYHNYAVRQYDQNRSGQRTEWQAAYGRQQQQNAFQHRPAARNTLKFDEEYNFEEANSQFEQMREQMTKLKVDEKTNGEVDKEDSGELSENEDDEKAKCYDKVKSFFDQISYESIERSKGRTLRVDWKTERKINSETFGAVALRRNNNYRGRGGYYNYQRGQQAYRSGNYARASQQRRPQEGQQNATN